MSKPIAMEKWLTVIGIGEEGYYTLSQASQNKITKAQFIIGGARHLAMLPNNLLAEKICWQTPLSKTLNFIAENRNIPLVVLATGDPMDFGIGVTLARQYSDAEMKIIPAMGAFSLTLAKLGWSRHDVHCLSLHGRPLHNLNPYLQPKQKLLVLANDGHSPKQIADYISPFGFATAEMQIFSHLGSETHESFTQFSADNPPTEKLPDLSVIAISLPEKVSHQKKWHSYCGLSDDAYQHDGKITKCEVRAATLAKLKPAKNAMLWDLGAGSGTIAIEWARLGGRAIAVENNAKQCGFITTNIHRLGNDKVTMIQTDIVDFLNQPIADLQLNSQPDAIFIGGGLSLEIAKQAYQHLAPNGRLVMNAVTIESQEILWQYAQFGGKLSKISLSHLDKICNFHSFKPLRDVMQFSCEKE